MTTVARGRTKERFVQVKDSVVGKIMLIAPFTSN